MAEEKFRPKLLHEYSVEELLSMMDSKVKESEIKREELSEEDQIQNQIIKFLIFYDIRPGKHRINIKTLLKLYRAWSGDSKIGYYEFWKGMNGQFKINNHIINYNKIPYIGVNTSLAKITKHIEDIVPKKINIKHTKNNLKYMEEFVSLHNIKPGSIYIESDILYYFFDYHNHKKKRKIISYYTFVSMCHLYFSSKQLGYGSTWFGVSEDIKKLITPEWIKVWRQGRVKYGYISRKKQEDVKSKIYEQEYKTEEKQKSNILYPETLPEKESEKQDEISSTESSVQSTKPDGTS